MPRRIEVVRVQEPRHRARTGNQERAEAGHARVVQPVHLREEAAPVVTVKVLHGGKHPRLAEYALEHIQYGRNFICDGINPVLHDAAEPSDDIAVGDGIHPPRHGVEHHRARVGEHVFLQFFFLPSYPYEPENLEGHAEIGGLGERTADEGKVIARKPHAERNEKHDVQRDHHGGAEDSRYGDILDPVKSAREIQKQLAQVAQGEHQQEECGVCVEEREKSENPVRAHQRGEQQDGARIVF